MGLQGVPKGCSKAFLEACNDLIKIWKSSKSIKEVQKYAIDQDLTMLDYGFFNKDNSELTNFMFGFPEKSKRDSKILRCHFVICVCFFHFFILSTPSILFHHICRSKVHCNTLRSCSKAYFSIVGCCASQSSQKCNFMFK